MHAPVSGPRRYIFYSAIPEKKASYNVFDDGRCTVVYSSSREASTREYGRLPVHAQTAG